MLRTAPVALLILFTTSVSAVAQPSAGTAFISAGAFADIVRLPSSSGIGADFDPSGTVAGGALGVGVFVTPRISARLEWALTDDLRIDQEFAVFQAMASSPFVGMTTFVPNFEQRRRTSAAFALLGAHVGEGRVALEVLGGLGLVQERMKSSYEVRILGSAFPTVFPPPRGDYTTTAYAAVGVAGLDVRVALTDHAAIVPQVRAYAQGGGLSVRPGLTVRWTF